LRLVGKRLAHFLLFLLSVLTRIGILRSSTNCLAYAEGQTRASRLIFAEETISAISPKQNLSNPTPFIKTIEKLRNLESLLIYAIT
jgi:hypothetical protein